jgi:hypothetical protein
MNRLIVLVRIVGTHAGSDEQADEGILGKTQAAAFSPPITRIEL